MRAGGSGGVIDTVRRLAEREIARADAAGDHAAGMRARHDRLRCVLLAALPAEMACAGFVSRLQGFLAERPETFDAALLDDFTNAFTTKRGGGRRAA